MLETGDIETMGNSDKTEVQDNRWSTNTEGLPKTNFNTMLNIGLAASSVLTSHPIHVSWYKEYSSSDIYGVEPGIRLDQELDRLDRSAQTHKFNVLEVPMKTLNDMVVFMLSVYLIRLEIRWNRKPSEMVRYDWGNNSVRLIEMLVKLAEQKDGEYGASWCMRGGIGAWFTVCRKFDRLRNQLKKKGYRVWDCSEPIESTESLEETIKDAINYLLLIMEKKVVINALVLKKE